MNIPIILSGNISGRLFTKNLDYRSEGGRILGWRVKETNDRRGKSGEERGSGGTEEVSVNPSFPDQLVTIGEGLSDAAKGQLKGLLKDNIGVFAWEPSDMTGVSRRVIEHALNVNPLPWILAVSPSSEVPTTLSERLLSSSQHRLQGSVSNGIQVQVLFGCLQGLPPNSNGRRGRRKNSILHRSMDLLLHKNAIRAEKYGRHVPKAGGLDLPIPDRKELRGLCGLHDFFREAPEGMEEGRVILSNVEVPLAERWTPKVRLLFIDELQSERVSVAGLVLIRTRMVSNTLTLLLTFP
ncbi:hypothetical protein Tco_0210830 [Tanacetum coccineum]